ncbi:hypothetical protein JTB14_003188 [Gonioctena quinquepunctata]|nr:hypothetical protein JTB14_003188 [Gonioctena quinquepunctata]
MELLIHFLETNRILVTGKTHPLHTYELDMKWVELTELQNGVESGAKKDKKQWKTFLYEWKSKTKKKARVKRENILQTGGGGYKCTDLNELENRLISIYGWVHIVGCLGAPDEVDPDNNGKSRTPTPELPTREILLEYDNDDEIIHIEVEADNFPPSSAETVNMPPCSSTQRKTDAVRKVPVLKKRTVQNGTTKLEKAAQSYSQSTEQMALAVREMAKTISELAEALCKIFDVVNNQVSSD